MCRVILGASVIVSCILINRIMPSTLSVKQAGQIESEVTATFEYMHEHMTSAAKGDKIIEFLDAETDVGLVMQVRWRSAAAIAVLGTPTRAIRLTHAQPV